MLTLCLVQSKGGAGSCGQYSNPAHELRVLFAFSVVEKNKKTTTILWHVNFYEIQIPVSIATFFFFQVEPCSLVYVSSMTIFELQSQR